MDFVLPETTKKTELSFLGCMNMRQQTLCLMLVLPAQRVSKELRKSGEEVSTRLPKA